MKNVTMDINIYIALNANKEEGYSYIVHDAATIWPEATPDDWVLVDTVKVEFGVKREDIIRLGGTITEEIKKVQAGAQSKITQLRELEGRLLRLEYMPREGEPHEQVD